MTNKSQNSEESKSTIGRIFEIGSLATSIGVDIVASKLGSVLQSSLQREQSDLDTWIRSAIKMTATLGNLKGAVMKLGQMLSLYDSVLPPEVITILSSLQKQAPPEQLETMLNVLVTDIPDYQKLIQEISKDALASASIGQVHRAVCHTNQEIVLKIQYPGIKEAIASDMGSLNFFLRTIFKAMPFKLNVEAVLAEIREMMLMELDYEKEALHQMEFRNFFKENPGIVIPQIIPELSRKRVLASVYEAGLGIAEIQDTPQHFRNDLGIKLFEFYFQQLFEFGKLHSDPNVGNFAYRLNGTIVVYDFGSVKSVPQNLIQGYKELLTEVFIHKSVKHVPQILFEMGIHHADGSKIREAVVDDWIEIYAKIFYQEYQFGGPQTAMLIEEIKNLGKRHFLESVNLVFPSDIIFIDRSFGGLIGNLGKLKASAHWGLLLRNFLVNSATTIPPISDRAP